MQSVSLFANFSDLSVTSIRLSIQNVVLDRLVEKNRLLHNEADLSSQGLDVVLLYLLSIDQDLAALNVVET